MGVPSCGRDSIFDVSFPISCRLLYQAESSRREVVKTCGDCRSGVSNEWDRSVNSEEGRFIRNVTSTITRYDMLAPGDKVVVGVSGGPDSVALLHVLHVSVSYTHL